VIGTRSPRARALMEDLYAPFIRTGNPLIVMDERSSELTKYAANSFLATKVSFMNDIANCVKRSGPTLISSGRGWAPMPGSGCSFSSPGSATGDHASEGCGGTPEHLRVLRPRAPDPAVGRSSQQATEQVIGERSRCISRGRSKGSRWPLGLAFKPNTDDVREAPSLTIIAALLKAGATVRAYDPEAVEEMKRKIGTR